MAYPLSPVVWTDKIDYLDTVKAADVNQIYAETIAVEEDLINTIKPQLISVNSQLADITSQTTKAIDPNIKVRRPLFTFTSDDGYEGDYTVLKPICETYNIPMTFFVASRIGSRISTAHLLELQNTYGCEIATHSRDHVDLTTLTESQIEEQLTDAYNDLTALGLTIKNMAYPNGTHNALVRRLVKKYYRCSCSGSVGNQKVLTGTVSRMDIPRVFLGTLSDGGFTGYPTRDTLNYYKALVDDAVTYNGWIVFVMHGGNASYTETQQQITKDLIVYIQSLNVDIVTLDEGFDIFGSANEIGDCTQAEKNKGLIVTPDGKLNTTSQVFVLSDTVGNSGVTSYTSILVFPNNVVSYTPIYSDVNNGFPVNAGMLVTNKIFIDSSGWFQEFYPNAGDKQAYRRNFANFIPSDWYETVPRSGSTGSRPKFAQAGMSYYDTTIAKPVFCKTGGISEVNTITITGGATSSGNLTLLLWGATGIVIALIAGDSPEVVADKISVGINNSSVIVSHVKWSNIIRLMKTVDGITSTSYLSGSTGVTETHAKTRTGVTAAYVDAAGATV